MKWFYLSWSPRFGEATYTRCFPSEEEREKFEKCLPSYCKVSKWEHEVKDYIAEK